MGVCEKMDTFKEISECVVDEEEEYQATKSCLGL